MEILELKSEVTEVKKKKSPDGLNSRLEVAEETGNLKTQ